MSNGIVSFSALGNHGRLGNQLFQIAATLAYAERHGKKAAFPKYWYCSMDGINYADYFENALPFSNEVFPTVYSERTYAYEPIPHIEGDVDLYGYFQSAKHFADHADIVRHYLKFDDHSKKRCGHPTLTLKTTCSIHVRRGDYLYSPHIYPVCSVDYYAQAIEYMKRVYEVQEFLVFGDDKAWLQSRFAGREFRIIEGQNPIEDLITMSQCDHNIIANSSFSWWASYINENPEKCVIAPKRWILNQRQTDVYLPEWIVM